MADLKLNGVTPPHFRYNGDNVDHFMFNGVQVWSQVGAPDISSFTVTPTFVRQALYHRGAQVNLNWQAQNADSLRHHEAFADGQGRDIQIPSGATHVSAGMPAQDASWILTASRANETSASQTVRFTYEVPAAISSFSRLGFHTSGGFPRIAILTLGWTITGNPVPTLTLTSDDQTHIGNPNPVTSGTGTLYQWSGQLQISKSLIGRPQTVNYLLSAVGGGAGVQSRFAFTWPQ